MKSSQAAGVLIGMAVFLLVLSGCGYSGAKSNENRITAAMASGGQAAGLEQLNMLADRFYTAATDGNRQLGYIMAARLELAADKVRTGEINNEAGWEAFRQALYRARKSLAAESSLNGWYSEAARIKLAADALLRPNAAVWLQYDQVLDDDWSRLRQLGMSSGDYNAASALSALQVFEQHVRRIELAALLQRPAFVLEALNNEIDYMRRLLRREDTPASVIDAGLIQLKAASARLFEPPFATIPAMAAASAVAQEEIVTSPMDRQAIAQEQLTVMLVSALVMGVLGLAGWRKFDYDKRHGSPFPPKAGGRKGW